MTKRSIAWFVIALLAFAVAGYAGTMLFVPKFRPELVRTLFGERPSFASAHFAGGAVALLAGATQFNARLRGRWLAVHRWLGRVYVVAIALGGAASLVLAFQSLGGATAHAGFGALA